MEIFKDSKGVDRELSLTIGKARKACKKLEIDFIEGEPMAICEALLIRKVLQIDLIWFLLVNRDELELIENESDQESFEENHLDGDAFESARTALFAEIRNFIQSVRPEMLPVIEEATSLIDMETTKSVQNAVSLLQSEEVKEAFSKMNADAILKVQEAISKGFSELPEQSD